METLHHKSSYGRVCANCDQLWPCEVVQLEEEITRLSDRLHELRAHPDYEYETTRTARKSGVSEFPDGDGWEPNSIVKVHGGANRNWDRFEFHEEQYWRRLKDGLR